VRYSTGWSKSLCAPENCSTKLMIWRWPSQNIFGMWTVLYRTRSSRTLFGLSINVWRLAGDTLNITCNFLYCNHQVHKDILIILYILGIEVRERKKIVSFQNSDLLWIPDRRSAAMFQDSKPTESFRLWGKTVGAVTEIVRGLVGWLPHYRSVDQKLGPYILRSEQFRCLSL
jgi:hypothetical protein